MEFRDVSQDSMCLHVPATFARHHLQRTVELPHKCLTSHLANLAESITSHL